MLVSHTTEEHCDDSCSDDEYSDYTEDDEDSAAFSDIDTSD